MGSLSESWKGSLKSFGEAMAAGALMTALFLPAWVGWIGSRYGELTAFACIALTVAAAYHLGRMNPYSNP